MKQSNEASPLLVTEALCHKITEPKSSKPINWKSLIKAIQ